ncbi:MAG: LLM class flavin-dependent oxidoreductase [Gammaproteobacteria bacterium]
MDIEIIIGCEMHPNEVAEYAVAAEQAGVRSLWHSNITNGWDPFVALVPAAQATSRIRLGVLALSPYEMHPLKIGYALASLNELANGRAMVGLGGGGAMALAIVNIDDEHHLDFKKMRIVRGVREAAEIIYRVTSGEAQQPYDGEVFRLNQRIKTHFITQPRPQIIACSMGPQMLRMGARIADGVQVGDVVPGRMPEVLADLDKGFAKREYPADDFRIGNFWAWHIKKDRAASMLEARRKMFARAEIIPPHIGLDHLLEPDEAQIVRDNFRNFLMADVDGSGEIKGVPPELVQRIIDEVSSAGDFSDIDREIERYKEFERAGLTDLAIRVFDEPMAALQTIKERVIPAFN